MKKLLLFILLLSPFIYSQDYVESYVSTDAWKGSISTTGVSYNGNIYIGRQLTGDYDVIIYFYDDGSYPNWIKWDDGSGHFVFGESGGDKMIIDPGGVRIINSLQSNDKFDLIGGVWSTASADMYIVVDQGAGGTVFLGTVGEGDALNVGGVITATDFDTVASATNITFGKFNNFVVTGTTQVDSISVASTLPNWTVFYIEFTGSCQFTDGANMQLDGNFSGTTDDMLTLQRRGNLFKQVAGSNN